jgi:hypothetical protein
MLLTDHIDALRAELVDIIDDEDDRLRVAIICAGTTQLITKLRNLRTQTSEIINLLRQTVVHSDVLYEEPALRHALINLHYAIECADGTLEACLTPLDSHTVLQENTACPQ